MSASHIRRRVRALLAASVLAAPLVGGGSVAAFDGATQVLEGTQSTADGTGAAGTSLFTAPLSSPMRALRITRLDLPRPVGTGSGIPAIDTLEAAEDARAVALLPAPSIFVSSMSVSSTDLLSGDEDAMILSAVALDLVLELPVITADGADLAATYGALVERLGGALPYGSAAVFPGEDLDSLGLPPGASQVDGDIVPNQTLAARAGDDTLTADLASAVPVITPTGSDLPQDRSDTDEGLSPDKVSINTGAPARDDGPLLASASAGDDALNYNSASALPGENLDSTGLPPGVSYADDDSALGRMPATPAGGGHMASLPDNAAVSPAPQLPASSGETTASIPLHHDPVAVFSTHPDIFPPLAFEYDGLAMQGFVPLPLPRPDDMPELATTAAHPAETDGIWPSPAQRLSLKGVQLAKARKCLAEAIYFESRGEPRRGQIAVAQVVVNRVFSGYYPADICGAVYQNAHRKLACQFTFACDDVKDVVREPALWLQANEIAADMLDGKLWLTSVGRATHYHAHWVNPRWVREMQMLDRIGVHTFYRPRNWNS